MKFYYTIGLVTILMMACSSEKKSDLQAQKNELVELKKQQVELTAKIKTLETDLAKAEPKREEQIRAKNVTVTPLASTTFKHFVELQGSIDAKNSVSVSPKSGGTITAVYVKEGDVVKIGSVLAKVDDHILRESSEEIKNQLSLANTVYEKQATLWKQQIGTEIQYLQAKNNKESLEKRLATLNAQLEQSTVTSPISGVVDRVHVKAGEMAMPGMGIVQVVNLSQLKVVAKVADTYAGSVRQGDVVKVRFPDVNKELTTQITFASTTVDPLSRTFTIEAPLPSDNSLKPNMLAQLKINNITKSKAIVVDQNLIQHTENGQLVYIAENERGRKMAKARLVKTGLSYGGQIEIIAGLKAGDQLITQGYQELVDGQPVNF